MADDVKIPISTPGAKGALEDLRKVAAAEKEVGAAAESSGKQAKAGGGMAADAMAHLGKEADHVMDSLKGMALGFAGLEGAKQGLEMLVALHEKLARTAEEAAQAMTGVLSLSSLAGQRKEVVEKVHGMAVKAGRPLSQMAGAYQAIQSGTAGMDESKRTGLLNQVAMLSQLEPSASPEALAGTLAELSMQQPNLSPNQVGNLMSTMREQAGGTLGDVGAVLPNLGGMAAASGADLPTVLGMFSVASRRSGGMGRAGSGVSHVLASLMNPRGPAGAALASAGMPTGGSLQGRLAWLAAHQGQLPPEVEMALGGPRGVAAVAAIAGNPEELSRTTAAIAASMGGQGSQVSGQLAGLYGESEMVRAAHAKAAAEEVMHGPTPAAVTALTEEAQVETRQAAMKDMGVPRPLRWLAGFQESTMNVLGMHPRDAGLMQPGFRPGAVPVSGGGTTIHNHGGTMYVTADGKDPAGKPVEPTMHD